MARPARGSVRWNTTAKVWEVRVTLADGKRNKPIPMTGLPPCAVIPDKPTRGCTCAPCKSAENNAELVSKRMRDGAAVESATKETVSEWFVRYHRAAGRGSVGRKNRGKPQVSVAARRSRFQWWVEPLIGTMPMASVTSADLRRVVQKLDEAVLVRTTFYLDAGDEPRTGRKPGLSAKTAANVWGEVTSGFSEAVNSKLDDLRILVVNPAIGVRPPTTGEDREQAALYPAEVVQLLSCGEISRRRRRLYFGALYTGMRRSELVRIEASDIDFEHDLITVRGKKGIHGKTSAAKRQIPIEPALRPLLKRLVEARKTGPIFDVPRADGKGGSSDLTKKDLKRAKLERADLWRDDAEHMPFTFHGCRHTAITHWAAAGRDATWLLLVAGHTDAEMTRRYLDKAALVRGRFGVPHPPVPPEILEDLLCDLASSTGLESSGRVLEFWSENDKSKTANSAELAAILTSPWRPQWESKTPKSAQYTSTETAREPIKTEPGAIVEPTEHSTVLVAESTPVALRIDPDEALRIAIKAALDAGDFDRVKALVSILESSPKRATVIDIATRRTPR